MINLWQRFGLFVITFAFFLSIQNSSAALYTGNGSGSGGGAIGNGSLALSDHGGTIFATLNKGSSGNFNDVLVLFIDTHSGSGFTTTTPFSDHSNPLRQAISGVNNSGSSRSTANFAPGFKADYALAISVDQGGAIYHLVSGNDLSPGFIRTRPISPNDSHNSASYTFNLDWSDLGLTSGSGFTFESTYITATGSRYLESFESTSGASGFDHSINFGTFDTYGVLPVPEPINTSLAVFGGIVAISGVASQARRLSARKAYFRSI